MLTAYHQLEFEPVSYQLNKLTIRGLACGDPQAKPLLCLHGWLDNAASFLPLMPQLIERRVIAIDWPGHGYSDHRAASAHYHFVDWLYDLLQLIEVNQWQPVDIVGHSMGGMIASAFAACFPEKVASITLIDAFGLITESACNTTKQLRAGLMARLSNHLDNNLAGTGKKKCHPDLASAVRARVLVSDLNNASASILVKRGLKETEQGYRWRADARLRLSSPYRFTEPQARQLITDLNCPLQLIYGSKGMAFVKKALASYQHLVPQLVVNEVVGGHHVHMEQPKQVGQLVLSFISSK